jgi:hypothetical protein
MPIDAGTTRELTQRRILSLDRFSEDTPDHVTLPQYVEYLARYARFWGITAPLSKSSAWQQSSPFKGAQSRIQFGWTVTKVNKSPQGGHIVTATAPDGQSPTFWLWPLESETACRVLTLVVHSHRTITRPALRLAIDMHGSTRYPRCPRYSWHSRELGLIYR